LKKLWNARSKRRIAARSQLKDQRPYRSGSSALIFFNCASWLLNVTWWRPIRHASRRSSSAAL